MDDLEQQILARMSTALQEVDNLDDINECSEAYSRHGLGHLHRRAVAEERHRRKIVAAEAAMGGWDQMLARLERI